MSFSPSSPDGKDVDVLPDSDFPPTEAPSSETPLAEKTTSDDSEGRHPAFEDNIVTPLEKDEEEPISSSIILMDKEELEEDKEKRNHHEQQQQEDLSSCSLSSTCSCAASLQEYIQQQCSVSLSKNRKCQATDKELKDAPIQTPALPQPSFVSNESQSLRSEEHQPHKKEQESEAVVSEATQLPGNTEETTSEPPLLEPSQTVNLPRPAVSESTFAKPTPVVEMSQLSSEEPTQEPKESQDLPEEKPPQPSASLGSSDHVKPTVSVSVDEAAAAEEKPDADFPHAGVNAPSPTQDKTDQFPGGLPTSPTYLDNQAEPPLVPESGPASVEVSSPVPEIATETEPSGSPAVVTEGKLEDLAKDISASSGGNGQLFHPSSPLPPSPASPSLSDIYAEPFNGTEQNGNLVHGSSQKESVFMRLSNRIKALEVNMSLSGRYLEQLSQRWGQRRTVATQ